MIDDIKREFEIIKSDKAYEVYSDGYKANNTAMRGIFSKGVVNETLAFSVLKKNDNPLFVDIIELGYIAYALALKSCWLTGVAIGWFIKEEGEKIFLLNKKRIKVLLKHYSKVNLKEVKAEILFKNAGKIFYQDRIGWEKREYGKRFIYRKRLALRFARHNVYRIEPETDRQKADKRYTELVGEE